MLKNKIKLLVEKNIESISAWNTECTKSSHTEYIGIYYSQNKKPLNDYFYANDKKHF